MTTTPLHNKDIDRVTGTRLGALWCLPAFGVVLPAVVLPPGASLGAGTRWFWTAVAAICWACFAWAWSERSRARRLVRLLHARAADLAADGVEHDGVRLTLDTPLVQYETRVSLLLIEIALLSAPRVHRRWLVPTVVTLLLGWWAFPWGPVHTIRGALQNVRGGRTSTVEELLAALSAPLAPRAAWWRRLLALDTGDTVQIAANLAIAVVFLTLVVATLVAIVVARWSGSGVPPP